MSRAAAPAPVRTTAGVTPLPVEQSVDAVVPMSTVVAVVCALAAAWMAAGSAGLFGHSLRHALTWGVLGGAVGAGGAAVVAGWPRERSAGYRAGALGLAAALAIAMTASILPAVNVAAVAVVVGVLA